MREPTHSSRIEGICNQRKGNKMPDELLKPTVIPTVALPLPVSQEW